MELMRQKLTFRGIVFQFCDCYHLSMSKVLWGMRRKVFKETHTSGKKEKVKLNIWKLLGKITIEVPKLLLNFWGRILQDPTGHYTKCS